MKYFMQAMQAMAAKEETDNKLKIIKSRAEALIDYIDEIKTPKYSGWFALFGDDDGSPSGFKFIGFFNPDECDEDSEPEWQYAVPMRDKEHFPEFIGW